MPGLKVIHDPATLDLSPSGPAQVLVLPALETGAALSAFIRCLGRAQPRSLHLLPLRRCPRWPSAACFTAPPIPPPSTACA